MDGSPIDRFLDVIDRGDIEALSGLLSDQVSLLTVDGTRGDGREMVIDALTKLIGNLRSMSTAPMSSP